MGKYLVNPSLPIPNLTDEKNPMPREREKERQRERHRERETPITGQPRIPDSV